MEPVSIERHAMHGDPMPEGLTQPEQLLFQSFRCLYIAYHAGKIDREQAQIEKKALLARFTDNQRWNQIYRNTCDIRVKLAGYSKEVEAGTCERCKKLMRIFDGRQIEPDYPRTEVTITEVGNA